MSAYSKEIDKTKCLSCFIKDEKMLERYYEIWKNFSNII